MIVTVNDTAQLPSNYLDYSTRLILLTIRLASNVYLLLELLSAVFRVSLDVHVIELHLVLAINWYTNHVALTVVTGFLLQTQAESAEPVTVQERSRSCSGRSRSRGRWSEPSAG